MIWAATMETPAYPIGSGKKQIFQELMNRDDRFTTNLGLHRIGDEAFVMCLMVHFVDLLRTWQRFPSLGSE